MIFCSTVTGVGSGDRIGFWLSGALREGIDVGEIFRSKHWVFTWKCTASKKITVSCHENRYPTYASILFIYLFKKKDSITLPQNGTFAIWMFPKIVGFSPQIIHFYWGFPLFSPSILGKTPFWKHPYVKRADLPPNIRWGYDRLVWGLGLGWLVGCLPVPPGGIHKKVVERMQGEHIEKWHYENHEWNMYQYMYVYIHLHKLHIHMSSWCIMFFLFLEWYFLPLEVAASEVLSDIKLQLRERTNLIVETITMAFFWELFLTSGVS